MIHYFICIFQLKKNIFYTLYSSYKKLYKRSRTAGSSKINLGVSSTTSLFKRYELISIGHADMHWTCIPKYKAQGRNTFLCFIMPFIFLLVLLHFTCLFLCLESLFVRDAERGHLLITTYHLLTPVSYCFLFLI